MNKNLLVVVNSFDGGGAEKSAVYIYEKIKNKFDHCAIIGLNDSFKLLAEKDDYVQLRRKKDEGIVSIIVSFIQFRKYVRKFQPTHVILHCELSELYVAFTHLNRTVNLIGVEHASSPWFGKKCLGMIVRLFLRIKHIHWVTVNRNQKLVWMGGGAEFIPNPNQTPSANSTTRSPEIIFIGRLDHNKQPNLALNAAQILGENIRVFGTGPLLHELKSKFHGNATFEGFVESPWVGISANSLVLATSLSEGDGLVVLEALTRGNPILLRDNKDYRRFELPEKNFFQSEADLEIKISNWRKNFDEYKVSKKYVQPILEERSLQKILARWLEVLKITSN